ncbi:hypothetical protein [Bacillus sp. FJAT-29937]|uniref:hypothetical protein n=1 Tax=Bacillus sp. FJAT-29937 TaxID=1720553 RepID=UPI00083595AA|nr:hypothetical protein [Bacillus sp. FJAT-29937]
MIKLRKYLGIVSIIIFTSAFLIMQIFLIGKVSGAIVTAFLIIAVGISVLLALFSLKGRLKKTILSLYGILIVGYITISILFAVAHM